MNGSSTQQDISLQLSELQNNQTEAIEKYLTFWSGGQLFGIGIAQVVQIIQVPEITVVPESPYYMKGIVCIRGLVIPVIDMRLRLGQPEEEYTGHTCIVLVTVRGRTFGLIVDAVESVEDIPDQQILPPPEKETGLLRGIVERKSVILIMNIDFLLGADDFAEMLGTAETFLPDGQEEA